MFSSSLTSCKYFSSQVRCICPYYFNLEDVFCSRLGMIPKRRSDQLFAKRLSQAPPTPVSPPWREALRTRRWWLSLWDKSSRLRRRAIQVRKIHCLRALLRVCWRNVNLLTRSNLDTVGTFSIQRMTSSTSLHLWWLRKTPQKRRLKRKSFRIPCTSLSLWWHSRTRRRQWDAHQGGLSMSSFHSILR